jgi:hypothetical protein
MNRPTSRAAILDQPWVRWPLVAAPFVFLVVVVALYGHDFVFADEYEVVPLVVKALEGELTLADLWAPQNEHRLFFPYLIHITIACFSGWRHGLHQAITVVLAACLFSVLCLHLRRCARRTTIPQLMRLLPLLALLQFSVVQWEIWLWGYHLFAYWQLLCVTLGFILLGRGVHHWPPFIGALALGYVAIASHGNGLIYWPAGFLTLVVMTRFGRRMWTRYAAWMVAWVLAYAVYFYGLTLDHSGDSRTIVFSQPLAYLQYICVYLGSAVANVSASAGFWVGLFGLIVFTGMTLTLLRRRTPPEIVAPLVAMALFALGCACMTGLGRLEYGVTQATSSRYTAFATLFWMAFVMMLALSWPRGAKPFAHPQLWRVAVLTLLTAASIASAGNACYHFTQKHAAKQRARAQLYTFEDEEIVVRMYPRVDVLKERIELLKKHKLSMFRED